MRDLNNIKVGDRIVFRSPTRSGCREANRIVNGFLKFGKYPARPTVKFNGWGNFVVRLKEIIEVIPEAEWRREE